MDCVYDDDATDALFGMLRKLISRIGRGGAAQVDLRMTPDSPHVV